MKSFMVVIVSIGFSFAARGQNYEMFKRKPWEETKLKNQLHDTLKFIFPYAAIEKKANVKNLPGVALLDLKGTFTGKNGKGDEIYAMQTDHMPCLVPDKKLAYNMPVAGFNNSYQPSLVPLLQNKENTDKNKK